ncbi:Uncharacterised protein [Vibrio cholerae]|nr:Uncharacterised protein [Vibrio cholerae]
MSRSINTSSLSSKKGFIPAFKIAFSRYSRVVRLTGSITRIRKGSGKCLKFSMLGIPKNLNIKSCKE